MLECGVKGVCWPSVDLPSLHPDYTTRPMRILHRCVPYTVCERSDSMAAFAVQIYKNTHSSFSTIHDWSTSYHIRCLLYCWDEDFPQKNLSLQHIKYQIGCVLSQRCSSITPGTKYKIHKMSLGLDHTGIDHLQKNHVASSTPSWALEKFGNKIDYSNHHQPPPAPPSPPASPASPAHRIDYWRVQMFLLQLLHLYTASCRTCV